MLQLGCNSMNLKKQRLSDKGMLDIDMYALRSDEHN